MRKDTMGIVRGMGTGLAAGMLVGYVGGKMMQNQPQMKKTAGKTINAVGDLLGNASYFLKKV